MTPSQKHFAEAARADRLVKERQKPAERRVVTCLRCGGQWIPLIEKPKRCRLVPVARVEHPQKEEKLVQSEPSKDRHIVGQA